MAIRTITDPYHRDTGPRKHYAGRSGHPTGTVAFTGVDGEGETLPSGEHRYVLLGIGDEQIEDSNGLQWWDIFDFLYQHQAPRTALVGFYLGYDFTQWLKTLPEDRAWKLLTIEGRESRRSKSPAMHGKFLPVDIDNWQIDMLGSRRMQIRRKECDCPTVKCDHVKGPWLYICDAGPFFQTSFLNVINPAHWQEPIVSPEEYETIKAGKSLRATATLGPDMRLYNRLENEVLARVMHDLDGGFKRLDVSLAPQQWFGPGQAAQSWMRRRAPKREEITECVPEPFLDAARKSYFGGWFEIQAHGIVPGTCYEYDINSAYPAIIATLPCLMHGVYTEGNGKPTVADNEFCLVRARVWGRAPHSDRQRAEALGAMLHRDAHGRISRPSITEGWYWWHELQASQRTGCIRRISPERYYEWVKYTPCDCPPPLRRVANLYQLRMEAGKDTSLGKSAKLVYNSMYGKTAQSVGMPQFANPVYASLITAGCRTMILDAIASHPGGKSNVVMVATDAVFFLDPHPLLTIGHELGEWEVKRRENLTLFKPGVYWDDSAREAIKAGGHVAFKARGINAKDFAHSIEQVDRAFMAWGPNPPRISDEGIGWPSVGFVSGFAMVTALQALVRHDWATAGTVEGCRTGCMDNSHAAGCSAKPLVQNANPADKRAHLWLDTSNPARPIYRSEPPEVGRNAVYRTVDNHSEWDRMPPDCYESVPYEKRFGMEDPFSDESAQAFGISPDEHQPYRGMFRLLTGTE
jgi:hypothetical protein